MNENVFLWNLLSYPLKISTASKSSLSIQPARQLSYPFSCVPCPLVFGWGLRTSICQVFLNPGSWFLRCYPGSCCHWDHQKALSMTTALPLGSIPAKGGLQSRLSSLCSEDAQGDSVQLKNDWIRRHLPPSFCDFRHLRMCVRLCGYTCECRCTGMWRSEDNLRLYSHLLPFLCWCP